MNTAAELAYPESLPDDLKVLLHEQKVPVDDPLVALLAWHWLRINESRDAIQDSTLTLKAALDLRIGKIIAHSDSLETLTGHLEALSQVLAAKPLGISQQIQAELAQPIAESVKSAQQIALDLKALLTDLNVTGKQFQRSRHMAAFLSGLSTGALLIPWTYSHFFSH
jgi:hypothetical protein